LGTGDDHYLVEGNVAEHSMRVLRDGVECPSLSPDGSHIAFKSRIGDNRWRLRVLDLSTLGDHPVAETHSIDDQVEWLNEKTLMYSDGHNVYTVPADGGGTARLLVRDATSPVRLSHP
jgi:Tol biopolymer transport system component